MSPDPDPDPAAGNPFAYAADAPLDNTDPTGHCPVDVCGAGINDATIGVGLAKAAAAAAVYQAAAAAKIPTYCGGVTMATLNTCMAAVYRAAGGAVDATGTPTTTNSHYSPAVANQAMDIVTKQYNNAVQDAKKRDDAAAQQRVVAGLVAAQQAGQQAAAQQSGNPAPSSRAKPATPVNSPTMPGGRNPLPGLRSVFGATALVGGTVGGWASSSEAEINALLGTSGNAALAKLNGAVANLANKSPSDLVPFLSRGEIAAVQEKGEVWFGRVVYGTAAERSVAFDLTGIPEIKHIGNTMVGKSVPDFYVIGENAAVPFDLTGPSASSISSHMNRWFVGSSSQILTYSRPSISFLKSMFGL